MPAASESHNNGATGAAAAHGASDSRQAAPPTKPSRSRTSIPTQSGKWLLVKTIGAGSMGKVKLARKEDGSEQVRPTPSIDPHSAVDASLRLTRSFHHQ